MTARGRRFQSDQDIRREPAAGPGPETDTVAWISPVVRSHSACPPIAMSFTHRTPFKRKKTSL